jgi:hypothetical protein
MAAPGDYTVTLSKQVDGIVTILSDPIPFKVEQLYKGTLDGAEPEKTAAFWQEIALLQRSTTAATLALKNALTKIDAMKIALSLTPSVPGNLDSKLFRIKQDLLKLDEKLNGNRSKNQIGEGNIPTIRRRINVAFRGTLNSTYGPTPTHIRSLEIARTEFTEFNSELNKILKQQIPELERELSDAGAPWMEGQNIPEEK